MKPLHEPTLSVPPEQQLAALSELILSFPSRGKLSQMNLNRLSTKEEEQYGNRRQEENL